MIDQKYIDFYNENGYVVIEGLFSAEEITRYKTHFETLRQHERGDIEDKALDINADDDPLKIYPRIMQPHRRDAVSRQWLLDGRLNHALTSLLGREPFAVQTMFYFKPPTARGQALHQDQYYLRVQPGTCMAAWMAIDDCDTENGCLRVVPGSQNWPLLCLTDANTEVSFTDVTVDLPADAEEVPVAMRAGDVLFFNGQIVHGSLPNRSADRFRRSLIGHYIVGEAEQVYHWYHPVLQMDGSPVELGVSQVGGTCGVWVDTHGNEVLEMQEESINESIFGTM